MFENYLNETPLKCILKIIIYNYKYYFSIAYVGCSNMVENNSDQKKRFLSSSKLMLVSVISQIEVIILKFKIIFCLE